jgi:peptide/nickel transport system substrate-binding protein
MILAMLLAACGTPAMPAAEPAQPAASGGEQQAAAPAESAQPEGLKDIPRNRTLIMAGLGGEHPGGFTDIELFNSYAPGLSRSGFTQACTEGLFYYNMIGDEFIPWIAEGYKYNDDFTEVVVTIRQGVEWSDGTPYTAKDVAFSLNLLLQNPDLGFAGEIIDTVKSAEVVDDLNVKIVLTGVNPRFVFDKLTFHADLGVPMVPAHVFEGQDPATFTNYDKEKGWPLCTGAWKLVYTDVQRKIWDLREDWWGAKTGFHPLPKVERMVFLPGMDENTMVQLISNNEIDLAFSFTAQNMELAQSQNSKLTTFSDEPPYGFLDWWPISLAFNTEIEPFNNPDVRWAISYSLNRDQIIDVAFKKTTTAIKLPYPGYPGMQSFFDSVSDLLEQYPTTEFNLD